MVTVMPEASARYAVEAARMRAIGIDVRDDEYERIDSFTSVQAAMFLHLCGIAPFLEDEINK